jgi:hypothetical protein
MITRRRLLAFGLLAGLLTLGLGGWMLWESMEARTVRPGMTFDEAKEILGDGPLFMVGSTHGGAAGWHRTDGQITVGFDSDMVVTSVEYRPASVFDRVRHWMRL